MNKSLLIFKHELISTIRRPGFIILTLALPIIALVGMRIIHSTSKSTQQATSITKIGYVDQIGEFSKFTKEGSVTFIPYKTVSEATKSLVNGDIEEYIVIPQNYITTGKIESFAINVGTRVSSTSQEEITKFLSVNLLIGKVPPIIIERVETPPNISSTTLTSTGAVSQTQYNIQNIIVPSIFSILMALALIFSSTYVLQGLGEEKENRLMEVLLSSVTPNQLITGKVLGIGLSGLIQVVVWVAIIPILLHMASSQFGGIFSTITIPAHFWVFGIIYFILGYLLFAVLSASIAAITSTVREAQGASAIFGIFAIAPYWFYSLLLLFPNSIIWKIFTIFPFSSPVLVMLRFGVSAVPLWQIATSIGVLILSIIIGILLSAKLLRIYLLMYGQRPTISEIIKNIKTQ